MSVASSTPASFRGCPPALRPSWLRALARFALFQASGAIGAWRTAGGGWPALCRLVSGLLAALRWAHRAYFGERVAVPYPETCSVVLLSYLRPANLDALVRTALRCEFVDEVVVCNNNPGIALSRWLSAEDERLIVLEQAEPTRQGIRLELATRCRSRFVISIDDDLFICAEQLGLLLWDLRDDPSVPHGMYGEARDAAPGDGARIEDYPFTFGIGAVDREVDHLSSVYAFTREQAALSLALAQRLSLPPPAQIGNGEDILISFSGARRARVHALGRCTWCMSWNRPEVATFRSLRGFYDERVALHDRLAALREADGGWLPSGRARASQERERT